MTLRSKIFTGIGIALVIVGVAAYVGLVGYWWSLHEPQEHIMYATWDPATLPYDNPTLAPARRHASLQFLRFRDFDADINVPPGVTLLQFTLNEYETALEREDGRAADRVLDVTRLLVKRGADINAHGTMLGDTPLHNAVLYNEPEVVRFLLDIGASAEVTINRVEHPWHGLTPAQLAVWLNINAAHMEPDWSEVLDILRHADENADSV